MKHKVISILCVFAFTSSVTASYKAVRGAIDHGATATFDLTVVNEKNEPLEDIEVEGWFWNDQKTKSYTKETDELGHVVIKGKSGADGGYHIIKDGYYETYRKQTFVREDDGCAKETFWGYEWVPIYKETVVLKTIRNPIPMYACRIERYGYKIPKFDQEIPFDLQKMDWCKPYGKGIRDDVYIQLPTILLDFDAYETPPVLMLRFKYPDEGVYLADSDMQSLFKSDYHVDVTKKFQQKIKLTEAEKGYHRFGNYDQHAIFRIRCKHDENGNVISAHYGKIYGSWLATNHRQLGDVSIYFNPTPNDTNLEYDLEKNLYKGDTYEEKRREDVLMP